METYIGPALVVLYYALLWHNILSVSMVLAVDRGLASARQFDCSRDYEI